MKVRPLLLGLSLCVTSTAAFAADDDATLRA